MGNFRVGSENINYQYVQSFFLALHSNQALCPLFCLCCTQERGLECAEAKHAIFSRAGWKECDQWARALEGVLKGTEVALQLVAGLPSPDCPSVYSEVQIEFCVVMSI